MDEPENILACPFCGSSSPYPPVPNPHKDGKLPYVIECMGCPAEMHGSDKYKTERNWNRRAGAPEHGATDSKAVGSSAWLEAAARMRDILYEEASAKHQMSPEEDGWSEDWHLELTVSVGELKAFGRAIAAASNGRDLPRGEWQPTK